jgi:hypothetical protein
LTVSVSIKIDDLANWSWASALWPLWVVLACLSVLSIGTFLLMIMSIFSYYYSDPSKTEVFSSIWSFYTSSGACLVLFLFGLDMVQEKYDKIAAYGISYLTIFVFITFLLRFHLQKWWRSFFFEDGHISIPSLSNSGPLPLPPSQALHMKKIIRAIKLPPRALVRLSSTYFQPASPKQAPKVVRTMSHDVKENITRENVHFRSLSSLPKENSLAYRHSADLSFVDKKCSICWSEECNSVFLECGHGGICHNCANLLMKQKRQCHMCRSPIAQVVKIKVEPGKVLNVIGTKTN